MKRACLGLAVLALAACGGSARLSKHKYEARLRAAFVAAQAAETSHLGGSGQVKELKVVATAFAALAARLRGTHGPADVQRLNDRLVAGASGQAHALDALATRLERSPAPTRYRVLAAFDANGIPGRQEFDRAVAALEARGYRFRTSGGT